GGTPPGRPPTSSQFSQEPPMILILAGLPREATVARLSAILRANGSEPLVVTPAILEQPSSFSITAGPDGARAVLHLPEGDVDRREVRAAWLWRGWRPNPLETRFRALAKQGPVWDFFAGEWMALHKGIALALAQHDVFCVNPPPWNTAFEE